LSGFSTISTKDLAERTKVIPLSKDLEQLDAHLAGLCREVNLADYAAQHYPDLTRAMIITTSRPWRWLDPIDSYIAWRIRHYQAEILELTESRASESHAMLYAGGGRCMSQGPKMGIINLKEYRHCRVTFWDWPDWLEVTKAQRDLLVAEAAVHAGEDYAYSDIAAILMWAITGNESWLEAWGDAEKFICSERVCNLVRKHIWAAFAGESTCLRAVPHWLAAWMWSVGFKPTVLCLT
jgi:hypothetical protein